MSAVKLKWLKKKMNNIFHARIGKRTKFACGKAYESKFSIEDVTPCGSRCEECERVIAFLEDMYGGATD